MKLEVQPVPRGNWGDNLAHLLPSHIWDALRKGVYKRENNRCQICRDVLKTLHCHENWIYNDKNKKQYLKSLMCLCYNCHNVIHWFRTEQEIRKGAYPKKYLSELREHFIKVNGCTQSQFRSHVSWADRKRHIRNFREYELIYGKFSIENIVREYKRRVTNET